MKIQRSIEFATFYHRNQTRKYTNEPYINHPLAVAKLIQSVEHTEDMVVAAILHDVVEDTNVTLEQIEFLFDKNVSSLVEMLTNPEKPSLGNRTEKNELNNIHTSKASPEAKTIKLADSIDNTYSLQERDPEFAKIYFAEKRILLPILQEGNPILYNQLSTILGV